MTDDGGNILWSVVDGETMLLDTASGEYFSLNQTATDVWQQLQAGDSEAQIVETVARTYRVDVSQVQHDVAELIVELRSAKLWP